MAKTQTLKQEDTPANMGRRDFIVVASYAMAGIGLASVAWPLIDQMNPAADTLALASIEVDISKIEVGQAVTVKWRGKPVFIRHRSETEITSAQSVQLSDLKDPQTDDERVTNPQFLVMIGVCTHLRSITYKLIYCPLDSYLILNFHIYVCLSLEGTLH